MKWPNVKLIFARELRDQLRDRRTLFTVVVLPIILYPLLGMAMLQVAQFMREYPTKVWVVGNENLPANPALVADGQVSREYLSDVEANLLDVSFSQPQDRQLYDLIKNFREHSELAAAPEMVDRLIQNEMKTRGFDVAVIIPSGIEMISGEQKPAEGEAIVPKVYLFQNSASDQSRIGAGRVRTVLLRWRNDFIQSTLSNNGVDPNLVAGIDVIDADVADKVGKQTAVWSKLFPFIIMIWSLTGAFYPAIDLCAGEKERGTFETLLSSPAARSEIAFGKLLTVMSFSIVTSVLNLMSMGFTGLFVVGRMGSMAGGSLSMGAPPIASVGWLLLALLPISALFSAIALAAAAFARSSKEGQYYLVPLMMISMPLMIIPMLPGTTLDFGTSLIPVTGLMLLLKGLIEGSYAECLQFAGPVCIVTFACCWFAVRWVVHQFNSESVLFRPSERFGVTTWMRSVMREREDLPSFGNAILCAVVILVAKFFIGFVIQTPADFAMFTKQTLVILVATIAVPAIMMALVLTRNPAKSLKLQGCRPPAIAAAILLAIMLNPAFTWFTSLVMTVYPPSGDMFALQEIVSNILGTAPSMLAIIAVFALVPAIFEELAFRGFILSGLESMRNKWQAILMTSLLFGVAHGVLQQSMITFVVGMVIGVIAVQTKSILPCMFFHLTHNSLAVLMSSAKPAVVEHSPILQMFLFSDNGATYQYAIIPGVAMAVVAGLLIAWFLRLKEEEGPTLDIMIRPLFDRLFRRQAVGA